MELSPLLNFQVRHDLMLLTAKISDLKLVALYIELNLTINLLSSTSGIGNYFWLMVRFSQYFSSLLNFVTS